LKAAQRAKDLVKQILAFSRQSGEERRPVRIQLVLNEVLRLLRASLPTSIEIKQSISMESGNVIADPTQIHQVVMNLCTNAHHAMLDHGGILEVTLDPVEMGSGDVAFPGLSPGLYVKLSVRDTGCGMTPGTVTRIFDPYFTTKEKGTGTGLGLATVHTIVKSHGGAIRVHSEPGKGTTFDVLFPTVESEERYARAMDEPAPRGNERVLFVDDEPAITDLAERMLSHLGYTVHVRTSSTEALAAFLAQPERFDLIITDMAMPHMTGGKLAREILKNRPDIPIILCTGFSETITADKAAEMGIKAFVMKPLLMHEMARTIRQVLDT
jgi:CheY-like chemotaxis protein